MLEHLHRKVLLRDDVRENSRGVVGGTVDDEDGLQLAVQLLGDRCEAVQHCRERGAVAVDRHDH